jgi:tetratricopeptide (TPR) repeat protein
MKRALPMIVLSCVTCLAQPRESRTERYREARRLYYLGADGDSKKYRDADTLFTQLYAQDPKNPRLEVYYGSLRLVEASRTWALWKKNSLSQEGIQLLDAAVDSAPDDLEIRFVRAATTYELPAFFHRREQSRQDFDYLVERAEKAARSGAFDPRLAAACFYYKAEFLKSGGKSAQAVALWKEATALAPGSRAARESAEELRRSQG